MKKILSVVLAAFVILISGICSFAAGTAELSFNTSGPDDNGKVVVDVVVSGSCDPTMLQFCIAYDNEKLECVSVNVGSVFSGKTSPIMNVTDGKIFFIWDSLSSIEGGTLLRIEFKPKAGSKNASVWVDETEELIVSDDSFVNVGVAGEKAEIDFSAKSENTSSNPSSGQISAVVPENSSESESSQETESTSTSESSSSAEEQSSSEAETGYSRGLQIDKTDITLNVGEEAVLSVTGTEKRLVWYSSNENIVVVEDGKIIPIAPGTATVTVITEDWTGEATCIVTVVGQAETSEEIQSSSEYSEQETDAVINVDSPRTEKEESSVPMWAWIVIAVLASAVFFVIVVIFKKGNANKKDANGGI